MSGFESSKWRKYLLRFPLQLRGLRYAELDSILDMLGLKPEECYDMSDRSAPAYQFLVVRLPSEEAAVELARRGVLIMSIFELWGSGATVEELLAEVGAGVASLTDEERAQCLGPTVSWSINIETVGRGYSMEKQHELRSKVFSVLPFAGPVQIKRAQQRFVLLDNYIPRGSSSGGATDVLEHTYLGREIVDGTSRAYVGNDDLKRRTFLGPTSLPSEISLIMANMAQVRPHSVVLDPFVGTGSILIACARFGAFCMGTDIDIRILRGKGGHNVFSNFRQYGLPPPELLRSDNALYDGHFRTQPLYHAIVCDPPYGIRAGARRTGSRRAVVKEITPEQRATHIPMTRPYPVTEVMTDLLGMAAKTLVLGGRLVYLLPWCPLPDLEPDQFIPTHPCLELLRICDQPLHSKLVRKFIIMRKVKEPSPDDPLPGRLEGDGAEYLDCIVPMVRPEDDAEVNGGAK